MPQNLANTCFAHGPGICNAVDIAPNPLSWTMANDSIQTMEKSSKASTMKTDALEHIY